MTNNSAGFQDATSARGETAELLSRFRQYRQTHDVALRDQLVCQHLHLVHTLTRRFTGLGESMEDLIQEGTIGLLNAVDLYDPDRGVKFSTYASHLITSQVQHYLRDRGRLIRQPAWVQELNVKVTRAAEALTQTLGRDPSTAEIAARLDLPEQSVKSVFAARELNHVASLSAPADGGNDGDLVLMDREQASLPIEQLSLPVEDRIVLEEAIGHLKVLEQKVVRLHFFGDLNQTEIARELGISVNYSSYLLRRAITKIKVTLEEQQRQDTRDEPAAVVYPQDVPTTDGLTGVFSSPYLRLRVQEEIDRSRRYPTNFTLMLTQVDGIADEGAQAVLAQIGRWLRDNTRVVDLVAYLGDGRFALLLPHTGREARVLGERLCQQAATHQRAPFIEPVMPLTLAVGFAVFPMDGATTPLLFERATLALDHAHAQGPNHQSGIPARHTATA